MFVAFDQTHPIRDQRNNFYSTSPGVFCYHYLLHFEWFLQVFFPIEFPDFNIFRMSQWTNIFRTLSTVMCSFLWISFNLPNIEAQFRTPEFSWNPYLLHFLLVKSASLHSNYHETWIRWFHELKTFTSSLMCSYQFFASDFYLAIDPIQHRRWNFLREKTSNEMMQCWYEDKISGSSSYM